MRRNICCHADSNAKRSIEKQVWNFCWKHSWFLMRAVIVRTEINCILFNIKKHFLRNSGELRLRISISSRAIAINGTEVSLPAYERIAKREVLCHTNQRFIHRTIAMWVIFSEHVSDNRCTFTKFCGCTKSFPPHGIQNASMYWLHAVAHVRQSAVDDDRHGIIQKGRLHFFDERYLCGSDDGRGLFILFWCFGHRDF